MLSGAVSPGGRGRHEGRGHDGGRVLGGEAPDLLHVLLQGGQLLPRVQAPRNLDHLRQHSALLGVNSFFLSLSRLHVVIKIEL